MCMNISISFDRQNVKMNYNYNYIWNHLIHGIYPLPQVKNINKNNTSNTISTAISSASSIQREYY